MSSSPDVRVPATEQHYVPRPIGGDFSGRHIVSVEQFARPDLDRLFALAADLRTKVRAGDKSVLALCQRKIMATLFYEASTRTDMSFQAAMQRLGGEVIATSGGVHFSSVYKGENLADTVRAVGSYADVVVLRHPEVRSSYEAAQALDQLATRLGTHPVVISGGDGIGEHPTQALLDLFTVIDFKHRADGLTVTLVGDLVNGRTVHSLAKLLALYGAPTCGWSSSRPPCCARQPRSSSSPARAASQVNEHESLDEVIGRSDVIYWTRVQQERFTDLDEYEAIASRFIMTPQVLAAAPADAILMHPLPRKHEMGTEADHAVLDDDPRSVYFHQMQNGMYVRMALLAVRPGRGGVTLLRIPGPLDPHVHLRDLDWSHKATVEQRDGGRPGGWLLGGAGHAQHAAQRRPRGRGWRTSRASSRSGRAATSASTWAPTRAPTVPSTRRGRRRGGPQDVLRPDDRGPAAR